MLIDSFETLPKTLIIEGCDGVGKTTLLNQIMDKFKDREDIILKQIRCPDNRDGANIRDVIMSSAIAEHKSAQLFLFLADFLYAFDSRIKPYIDDPKVHFIFDRFLTSSSIYQGFDITYLNMILQEGYPEFCKFFSQAEYVYLTPGSFKDHKARLAKKKGDEINHLDPVGDEAILKNITDYKDFLEKHKVHGLLGSRYITEYSV